MASETNDHNFYHHYYHYHYHLHHQHHHHQHHYVLTVNNVCRLHVLKFTHLWHKNLLPSVLQNFFYYARNVHSYNTRYASRQNLYKSKVRTNSCKQTIAYVATALWDSIPANLKDLNVFNFSKKLKQYLLSEQQSVT